MDKKKHLNFDESLKPYLYKAIYNRCITYLESQQHLLNIEGINPEVLINQKITTYNQQDSLLLQEISDEIVHVIERLPPQCKKVFTLSRKGQLKNREIASLLQISEKTVEDPIRKTLKELRIYLHKNG